MSIKGTTITNNAVSIFSKISMERLVYCQPVHKTIIVQDLNRQ